MKKLIAISISLILLFVLAACSNSDKKAAPLTGNITIDGSSTVYPLAEAIGESFNNLYPDVKVTIGESGTGGGFVKFCAKETNISNASRLIKDEEAAKCQAAGVEYIQLPIAYDGITVVINKENTWASTITTAELKAIFKSDSTIKTWKDVNAAWPDVEIQLFSPGDKSGTFDYFREAILGKDADGKVLSLRADNQVSFSEDDNVLVTGVTGNKYALGFFGFSYYEENMDKLTAVAIDAGKGAGAIAPTQESINDGSYVPLSRTLYIYVNKTDYEQEQIKAYTKFFIDNAKTISQEVKFVPLPDEKYKEAKDSLF